VVNQRVHKPTLTGRIRYRVLAASPIPADRIVCVNAGELAAVHAPEVLDRKSMCIPIISSFRD
jgi:hypothetical protein